MYKLNIVLIIQTLNISIAYGLGLLLTRSSSISRSSTGRNLKYKHQKELSSFTSSCLIFGQIMFNPCPVHAEQGTSLFLAKPSEVRALKEFQALKDLQDDRLAKCADRGLFWEQCFMYGETSERRTGIFRKSSVIDQKLKDGLDYQLISPMGAIESENTGRKNSMPPTW